jgi:hypothetical protein
MRWLRKGPEALLYNAINLVGNYDPQEVLPNCEGMMTEKEVLTLTPFLQWVHDNGKHLGPANIKKVYAEFKKSKKKPTTGVMPAEKTIWLHDDTGRTIIGIRHLGPCYDVEWVNPEGVIIKSESARSPLPKYILSRQKKIGCCYKSLAKENK